MRTETDKVKLKAGVRQGAFSAAMSSQDNQKHFLYSDAVNNRPAYQSVHARAVMHAGIAN